jgi:valyl-tRNA synthetase
MDEGLSRAVIKVFVELYRAGLIYKDKRLVNWDPKLQTAISDLEVISVETKGHLWYFKYPIKNPGKLKHKHIVVATTRPETMLGDTAVAVNPRDKRWKSYVGKTVILPLVGREIPIIADDYADPEQGSGAVKITPAHDFNDFEVGRRHNLPLVNIFDPQARLVIRGNSDFFESQLTTEDWQFLLDLDRLDRFVARKEVIARLEHLGLVEKIEPHILKVPYGDRSNEVAEPLLTDQWYVNAKVLAQSALQAVKEGKTDFIPENWRNIYFRWLDNIQPWCISRQIWWGHQIPAWYGPLYAAPNELASLAEAHQHPIVAASVAEAVKMARERYPNREIRVLSKAPMSDSDLGEAAAPSDEPIDMRDRPVPIWRDKDVLDTWFSSALWPFSTLGWPDKTPELKRYYPTTVLVTGFDIIFFWVARMMMMGMHFMKKVPFRDVYIHALVRDERGAKMSKSKGNVVDPLSVMDEYGADALRFTMAAMAAQGRDIKLSLQRVEGYRNFATKLWNAARFCEMNHCIRRADFDPAKTKTTLNKWIYAETGAAAAAVTAALEAYRFNEAAGEVYRFVWNKFCDWYLEFAKPVFMGSDAEAKAETQAMAAWALDEILKLLHPFMPFVTEELWAVLGEAGPKRETLLCLADWPEQAKKGDRKAAEEVNWVIDLISEIRSLRSEMNVPAGATLPLTIAGAGKETKARSKRYESFLKRIARLSSIAIAEAPPAGSAQFVLGEATMALALGTVIDLSAERERLTKEIEKLEREIEKIDARFANEQFMAKAPEDVVEENRERRAEAEAAALKLRAALKRLAAAAA